MSQLYSPTLTGPSTHVGVKLKQISYATELSDNTNKLSHAKMISVSDIACALKFWGGPGGAT